MGIRIVSNNVGGNSNHNRCGGDPLLDAIATRDENMRRRNKFEAEEANSMDVLWSSSSSETSSSASDSSYSRKSSSSFSWGDVCWVPPRHPGSLRFDPVYRGIVRQHPQHSTQLLPQYGEFRLGQGDPLFLAAMDHDKYLVLELLVQAVRSSRNIEQERRSERTLDSWTD